MKCIRLFAIFMVVFILIGCSAGLNHSSNPSIGGILTFPSDEINTIAPYSYSTTKTTGYADVRYSVGPNYLSCNSYESSNFEPMVFLSDDGTKILFENASISELDNEYYFIYIGNLLTVDRKPTVVYKEIGKDEFGNTLYEPQTVEIDVRSRYGENYAIIDMNNGEVYLINEPGNYGDYLQLRDRTSGVFATDKYLYFFGYNGSGRNNLYRIAKSSLGKEPLKALFSSDVLDIASVRGVSDDLALINGRNWELYLLDITGGYSPTRIIKEDYSEPEVVGVHGRTYPFEFEDNELILGNRIFAFSIADYYADPVKGHCYAATCSIMNMQEGILTLENTEYEVIDFEIGSYGGMTPTPVLVYSETSNGTGRGLFRFVEDGTLTVGLLYAEVTENGSVSMDYIALNGNDRTAVQFAVYGTRVYWIGGANDNANGSYIRYYDFSTESDGRFKLPGKPAASSDFSLSQNGTIIYLQYLSDVQIGTYSWNPERDDYPTLIMMKDGDVHSIVNISTL